MASKSGRARAKSSAAPLAMMVSVPSCAFGLEPGHRRVDEADAALRQRGGDAPAVAGRDGGHVDAQRTLGRSLRDAVLAEDDLLHLGAVDHHRDDHVARGPDLRRRRRHGGAVLGRPRLGALARAVVDGQLVARPAQVRCLARAHDPQPDEADALHGPGSYESGVRRVARRPRRRRARGGGPPRQPRCGCARRAWPGSATRARWPSSRP